MADYRYIKKNKKQSINSPPPSSPVSLMGRGPSNYRLPPGWTLFISPFFSPFPRVRTVEPTASSRLCGNDLHFFFHLWHRSSSHLWLILERTWGSAKCRNSRLLNKNENKKKMKQVWYSFIISFFCFCCSWGVIIRELAFVIISLILFSFSCYFYSKFLLLFVPFLCIAFFLSVKALWSKKDGLWLLIETVDLYLNLRI